jgi:hypothetical protein
MKDDRIGKLYEHFVFGKKKKIDRFYLGKESKEGLNY